MIFFISGDWYSMFFLLIDEFKTLFYIQDYLIKRWFLILQKFSKCSKVLKPVKTGLTRSEKFYGTVVLYEILLWIKTTDKNALFRLSGHRQGVNISPLLLCREEEGSPVLWRTALFLRKLESTFRWSMEIYPLQPWPRWEPGMVIVEWRGCVLNITTFLI